MVKTLVKTLVNKIKSSVKKTIIGAGLVLYLGSSLGCPDPYPYKPLPSYEPTPIQTEKPSPTPEPSPKDYLDLSGKVVENESYSGKKAVIRLYDASDSEVEAGNYSNANILKETVTDNSGNFSITLDKLNTELPEGVVARTATGSSWDNRTSYITTLKLPQGDKEDLVIAPTMYNGPLSYDDGLLDTEQKRAAYVERIGRTNSWSVSERIEKDFLNHDLVPNRVSYNPNSGIKKINFIPNTNDCFQGIEVISEDFNEAEFEVIKNYIKNSGHPLAQYIADNTFYGSSHSGQTGWFGIGKSDGLGPYAILGDMDGNGHIEKGAAFLNVLDEELFCHEFFYHVIGANCGHSDGRTKDNTYIPKQFGELDEGGLYSPGPTKVTPIGKKSWYTINSAKGMDKLYDVLGLK